LIRRTREEAGAPPALHDEAWRRYRQHYLAVNGRHAATIPGAPEGLAAPRGVASSMRGPAARLACASRGAATRLGAGLDFGRAGSQGYNHGKPAHAAGAGLVVDRLDELAVRLGLTAGPAT
jgi:phosphoglycolate phosphatase-like HAD superfamily hydrolase